MMLETIVVILSGFVGFLTVVAFQLYMRLRLLESATAILAPVHTVLEVARKVEKLEGQMGEGFSKAAEVMTNLHANLVVTNAAVRLHAEAAEKNYIKRAEVN